MDSAPVFRRAALGPVRLAGADESADTGQRWVVTRYDDAVAALSDPRLRMQGHRPGESANCSFTGIVDAQHARVPTGRTATEILREAFFVFDPPVHTRLHKVVVRYFSAKRMELLRPRVQSIADELLDDIADREQVDLIKTFAFPLPVRVLCEVLNVPERISKRFLPPEDEIEAPIIPLEVAHAAVFDIVDARRREPGDDMISGLLAAHEQGEISREELLALPLIMLIAGYLTTVHLIGNGVLTLLRQHSQYAELRRDPTLVPSAVEEVLRYAGSIASVSRFAREDVEIGGTTIPRGSQVRVMMGAANRDPSVFSDPDDFDIRRGETGLAFGHGINYCLGSYLARVEGEVAIGSLLRRFPDLALTESVAIREIEDGVIGLDRLPVRLTAPAPVHTYPGRM